MKIIKKVCKVFLFIATFLLLLIAVADAAWIYVPQLTAQRKIDNLENAARDIVDITVPDGAAVIALGEASHGNVEFQQLKLSVLQQLVAQGVRAFALEADFGEGLLVNRFIHGEGDCATVEDVIEHLSFTIYHTQQMADLFQWMRDYNAGVSEEEQLSFYGFDLQNPRAGLDFLLSFCEEENVLPELDKSSVQSYIDGTYSLADEQAKSALECLGVIKNHLTDHESEYLTRSDDVLFAVRMIDCVENFLVCLDNGGVANYIYYNDTRDGYMAENVLWVLEYLKTQGCDRLMISGHNGHVGCRQQFYTPMGAHLREKLGSRYFAIGTDYYHTTCNINAAGADTTRGDYRFCSADPFAANAKKLGKSYYLSFAEALENGGETAELLQSEIYMGSLGEGYSWTMHIFPMSHRIKAVPITLYDGMIFVYDATPISVF